MDRAVFFRRKSDLGCIVALDLRALPASLLEAGEHEAERAWASSFHPRRKRTFFGGRHALRRALADAACTDPGPVPPNVRGAPLLIAPTVGSVSHKDDVAAAIAATVDKGFVGIDVEHRRRDSRTDISRFVLTDDERAALGGLSAHPAEEELLLRFSLKEALYKVLDPVLRRYVGFHEVEVQPQDDGTATVRFLLKEGHAPEQVTLQWDCVRAPDNTDYFLSTAHAVHRHWDGAA